MLSCVMKNLLRLIYPVVIWALPAVSPFLLNAQIVSPAIDAPNQPFSYFSKPTDEIGLMDAEAATEITPEGYLRTGFEELMFFSGADYQPTSVRIRTLEQGHLPIVHYEFTRDGIVYRFTIFEYKVDKSAILRERQHPKSSYAPAFTPDDDVMEPLVNFIRVEISNPAREPHPAVFASGVRYDAPSNTGAPHGDNRFTRPVKGKAPGDYRQIGEEFNPHWRNAFDDSNFFRFNRDLYSFPAGYTDRRFTLREPGSALKPVDVLYLTDLNADPTTPIGIVTYSRLLKPGEKWTLDFKMPVIPNADPSVISAIDDASLDAAKAQAIAYWNDLLASGMQVTLPESKPVDTFYSNIIYDLMAIDHIGPDYIQTVNKLNYHAFWLRDGSDIVHSYDLTGYPQIARECLDFFQRKQQPDGNFLSQPEQYDGWGEAVWAYGQHYRITHDKAFAEWALPQIDRAVDWLHKARAADPLHIVPASDVRDNEYVKGHITGYNFLALDGLELAIEMAVETGHANLAQKWQAEYDDFHQAFFKVLDAQAAARNGYIPPSLDGQAGGFDWGNLLSVVPEPVLDPHDPRVTATLKATQAKYAEGIMTYADGEFLHHYLTIKNTLTETIRGDQEQAIREFYAILVHTSSTNAGFEYKIRPWGDRDFGDDLAPHGWFAAEYRTLLRNMLLREDGNQLHLISAISPAWIGRGKTIAVRQAPTNFGLVAFTLDQPQEGVAVLHLNPEFTVQPASIVVHLPWFVELKTATADGKPVQATDGTLTVSSATRAIELHWTVKPNAPRLSYERAVSDYKAEYARRYRALMHEEPAAKP
jgi:hypothetical protein